MTLESGLLLGETKSQTSIAKIATETLCIEVLCGIVNPRVLHKRLIRYALLGYLDRHASGDL